MKGLRLRSAAGGFTLLEVLIASVLLSLILGALYSTFFLSHKAVQGLDESMLRLQECRGVLDMLRREIDASFYRDGDKNTIFRIDDRDMYGKQASRITFTGFSSVMPGVTEMRYYIEESGDKLTLYKGILTPFSIKEKIQESDLVEDVEEFLIEAREGDKWVRTWDSALLHSLPEEVKITVKIKVKDKKVLLSVRARPMIK
ncbi:MAG: prepilin-type N-terminal cleavage/methylation domain-containing protein [Nitrospirae bacterium]|nr:prepilin-type N-terminal cleavage/methylation domain-containing protein [Nitrospirota bacterium]